MISQAISRILTGLESPPVLIDVGASGEPPQIWESIAQHAVYVGFDPDLRDIYEETDKDFAKAIMVNKAITDHEEENQVEFHLTSSPHCSSILRPDSNSLRNFLFSDLFHVESREEVQATTLNSVLQQLSLPGIDWLKTDSQGMDLRIFNSLADDTRSQVLAVDIEPGLIDAYIGEDLFVDAHKEMASQGFWLSNLNVQGAIRMQKSDVDRLSTGRKPLHLGLIEEYHKQSPAWCEARYFRTINSLSQGNFVQRSYVLLWIFSLLDRQYGFALQLVFEYERVFGKDELFHAMLEEVRRQITRIQSRKKWVRSTVKSVIPAPIKHWVKRMIG